MISRTKVESPNLDSVSLMLGLCELACDCKCVVCLEVKDMSSLECNGNEKALLDCQNMLLSRLYESSAPL